MTSKFDIRRQILMLGITFDFRSNFLCTGCTHGIAHASVVVTFGKNQPFFYSKGKSIKEREACRKKEEETWYECHIFEILKLSSFHFWNIKMVPI